MSSNGDRFYVDLPSCREFQPPFIDATASHHFMKSQPKSEDLSCLAGQAGDWKNGAMAHPRFRRARALPSRLRWLFWDYDFRQLAWDSDRDLITARNLTIGELRDLTWLRKRVSDEELKQWIVRRRGAGLSPKQLRFWEVILQLPQAQVSRWLQEKHRQIWDRRALS